MKKLISNSKQLVLMIFVFFIASQLFAQRTETDRTSSPDPDSRITYCDDHISQAKANLEKSANNTCKSIKRTITCQDRRSGLDVHVTIVVQPTNKKGCPNSVSIVEDMNAEPLSRGARPDFAVEIMQEACSRGGSTITAFVPGDDGMSKKKSYAYNWFDGNKLISTDRTVECVNKDNISLKVTQIATGQFVKHTISLDASPTDDGRKPYKMAGFEKTACYGSCPVYKVAFNSDGKVTWKGIANTEKMGDWEAEMDERMKAGIKDATFKYGYFDLYNKYPIEGEIADASRTITYVRVGDMEKSVTHTAEGPDNLVEFENTLKKIIDNLEWKRAAQK